MDSQQLLELALAHSYDGVAVAQWGDGDWTVLYANPALAALAGVDPESLPGTRLLQAPWCGRALDERLAKAIAAGHDTELISPHRDTQGRTYWQSVKLTFVTLSDTRLLITAHRDITQHEYVKSVLDKINLLYREMSRRLEYANELDTLTQLKNRSHLCTRGEFVLGAAKRQKLRLHLLLIDVDGFKQLNMLGGRALGDECLRQVAQLINLYFSRATDLAVRLSDDEFVMLCLDDDDERVLDRAQCLRRDIRNLTLTDTNGQRHSVAVSSGLYSVTPTKHTTLDQMIQQVGRLVYGRAMSDGDCFTHIKDGEATGPPPR